MHSGLIIVPARGGSKRLPGKNLKMLAGRSLLAHTALSIKAAGVDFPVMLTTDCEDIAAEGNRLGWSVPFLRPAELARDDSPTIDAIIHALNWCRGETGHDPEAIMVLQPTSPLRGSACLRASVDVLSRKPRVDSVISMKAVHIAPARMFFAMDNESSVAVVENDSRKPAYVPNGAVYLTRTRALREANSLYAGNIYPLAMNEIRSVDVDTEHDWRLVEAIIKAGLPPDNFDHRPAIAVEGSLA